MPLRMFELSPGTRTRYRVVTRGQVPPDGLMLEASRPEEGLSVELELQLVDSGGEVLSSGRVPLDRGSLAVIREVERQVETVTGQAPSPDFELVHLGPEAADTERELGRTRAS